MPQNDLDKADKAYKYVINGLFGNDDYESISRVTLVTNQLSTSGLLDSVIQA